MTSRTGRCPFGGPAALLFAIVLLAGCGGTSTGHDEHAATDSHDAETAMPVEPVAEPPDSEPAEAHPVVQEFTLPAGTVLAVTFEQPLSSDASQPGDQFSATVVEAVQVAEQVVVVSGSVVSGEVIEAKPAPKIGGKAMLNLHFTSLRLEGGEEYPIEASFTEQAKSQVKKDAATIGGATAGGAILGRIIGHKQGKEADGTTIGALVGAAVGTAIAASNEGQEVMIPAGTTLYLELATPVQVTLQG